MKIKLIGGDMLLEGLSLLLPELGASLCDKDADLTVTVTEKEEDILNCVMILFSLVEIIRQE